MENNKLFYEKPELTLKYFLFGGDIATISSVDSSHAPDDSDNVIEASEIDPDWWG